MKTFRSFAIASIITLTPFSAFAQGFGINLGPFSMQFNLEGSYYAQDHKDILDSPICYAISNQKALDVIVEGKEKVSPREVRITTKRLVIEPYAFGITQDGKPVLHGNVTKEKLVKEVTIKFGDDVLGDSDWSEEKDKGFFSGWFKSEKSQNIDIRKISNLYVINESHFDIPKNYKGIKNDNIRVICQLPISE